MHTKGHQLNEVLFVLVPLIHLMHHSWVLS
jgi:hypothetical protein